THRHTHTHTHTHTYAHTHTQCTLCADAAPSWHSLTLRCNTITHNIIRITHTTAPLKNHCPIQLLFFTNVCGCVCVFVCVCVCVCVCVPPLNMPCSTVSKNDVLNIPNTC